MSRPVVFGRGNAAPIFPPKLNAARVTGTVIAQFIVGTNGRVEASSIKILKSSHELFSLAVKNAVATWIATPAALGSVIVRQVVEREFEFTPP